MVSNGFHSSISGFFFVIGGGVFEYLKGYERFPGEGNNTAAKIFYRMSVLFFFFAVDLAVLFFPKVLNLEHFTAHRDLRTGSILRKVYKQTFTCGVFF